MQKAKAKHPTFQEEQKLWQKGYDFVVGLDEVGRGPLAGPVTAVAVMVRKFSIFNFQFPNRSEIKNLKLSNGIRDSKKLTPKQREVWYEFLITHPDIKWGIGVVSEKIIDQINILAATKLAMKRALTALAKKGVEADYLLLDGIFLLEGLSLSQKAVIRGDAKIWSCAAASIIAKVTRDRLMVKYHQKYPAYGFDKHKGYGTKQHLAALRQNGPSAIHRKSFHLVLTLI